MQVGCVVRDQECVVIEYMGASTLPASCTVQGRWKRSAVICIYSCRNARTLNMNRHNKTYIHIYTDAKNQDVNFIHTLKCVNYHIATIE